MGGRRRRAGITLGTPHGLPSRQPPSSRQRLPACAARRRGDVTTAAIKARRGRARFLSAGAARRERYGAGESGRKAAFLNKNGEPAGGAVGRVRSRRPPGASGPFPRGFRVGGGRAGPGRL